MRERDLPFDRSKHAVYSKKAKKCVRKLLRRYYDEATAAELWEKVQRQYCAFLQDEPAMGGVKMKASIYDPILIFAWYAVVPDKPPLQDIQQDVYECFMGGFDALGKLFDLNRALDMRIANLAFKKAGDRRVREIKVFPGSFDMRDYAFDRENGVVRYCFVQCPNAEFAKRHHMENVLPVMCNCDHMAMNKLHATLIREGTCCASDVCDYRVVGDRSPLAGQYRRKTLENGLWVSVKK